MVWIYSLLVEICHCVVLPRVQGLLPGLMPLILKGEYTQATYYQHNSQNNVKLKKQTT